MTRPPGTAPTFPFPLTSTPPRPRPGSTPGLTPGASSRPWKNSAGASSRPDAVRHGQTTHDQRLVEPFLPGRDTQIFTVYDTHPDYAPDLFAPAIDGLTPPPT